MNTYVPSQVIVQSNNGLLLMYRYVDASGGGFGNYLLIRESIYYQIGTWGKDAVNSSNWRKFESLVMGMKEAGTK